MPPAPRFRGAHLLLAGLLVGWIACAASTSAADSVIISEFAASNSNGLRDEDGAYSDWIELFNGGTSTVNLLNWALTDSASDLAKWKFPAANLPPNGFLVVFASGKNRRVPGAPLHANFQLSAGGEYLALVRADGSIASEFNPFPEQFANISYGIGQNLQVTSLITNNSPALVFVPSNNTLGLTWTATELQRLRLARGHERRRLRELRRRFRREKHPCEHRRLRHGHGGERAGELVATGGGVHGEPRDDQLLEHRQRGKLRWRSDVSRIHHRCGREQFRYRSHGHSHHPDERRVDVRCEQRRRLPLHHRCEPLRVSLAARGKRYSRDVHAGGGPNTRSASRSTSVAVARHWNSSPRRAAIPPTMRTSASSATRRAVGSR